MTEALTITQVGILAMIDFAAQPGNEQAFVNGKTCMDHGTESRIFQGLLTRLELPALLERAKYGQSSQHLSTLTYHVAKSGMSEVHKLRDHLKETYTEWPYPTVCMSEFSEIYWGMVIDARIKDKDFRRAWDDIRKAAKEEKPFGLKNDRIDRFLTHLLQAMRSEGLITGSAWHGTHHFHRNTPLNGLSFLLHLYPQAKWRHRIYQSTDPRWVGAGKYEFTYDEGLILEFSEFFANERKKKRGKKAARH